MSMKTILVPMEPHEGMGAVLETALLLAKKRGSYIEGFPLRFGISEFVAVDPAGSIPLESYRQESQEEAAQARKLFEIVHAAARHSAIEPGPAAGFPAAGSTTRRRARASSAATAASSISPC